jgi:hypothetical protein
MHITNPNSGSVPTASQIRQNGISRGLTGSALEAWVKADAFARHNDRVEQARRAAANHWSLVRVSEFSPKSDYEASKLVSATAIPSAPSAPSALFLDEQCGKALTLYVLTILDRCGIGGIGGTGYSGGTHRIPPFDTLGKGRKYANDGLAWTAAIEDAASIEMNSFARNYLLDFLQNASFPNNISFNGQSFSFNGQSFSLNGQNFSLNGQNFSFQVILGPSEDTDALSITLTMRVVDQAQRPIENLISPLFLGRVYLYRFTNRQCRWWGSLFRRVLWAAQRNEVDDGCGLHCDSRVKLFGRSPVPAPILHFPILSFEEHEHFKYVDASAKALTTT